MVLLCRESSACSDREKDRLAALFMWSGTKLWRDSAEYATATSAEEPWQPDFTSTALDIIETISDANLRAKALAELVCRYGLLQPGPQYEPDEQLLRRGFALATDIVDKVSAHIAARLARALLVDSFYPYNAGAPWRLELYHAARCGPLDFIQEQIFKDENQQSGIIYLAAIVPQKQQPTHLEILREVLTECGPKLFAALAESDRENVACTVARFFPNFDPPEPFASAIEISQVDYLARLLEVSDNNPLWFTKSPTQIAMRYLHPCQTELDLSKHLLNTLYEILDDIADKDEDEDEDEDIYSEPTTDPNDFINALPNPLIQDFFHWKLAETNETQDAADLASKVLATAINNPQISNTADVIIEVLSKGDVSQHQLASGLEILSAQHGAAAIAQRLLNRSFFDDDAPEPMLALSKLATEEYKVLTAFVIALRTGDEQALAENWQVVLQIANSITPPINWAPNIGATFTSEGIFFADFLRPPAIVSFEILASECQSAFAEAHSRFFWDFAPIFQDIQQADIDPYMPSLNALFPYAHALVYDEARCKNREDSLAMDAVDWIMGPPADPDEDSYYDRKDKQDNARRLTAWRRCSKKIHRARLDEHAKRRLRLFALELLCYKW